MPAWNYQWLMIALTNAVFFALIRLDRNSPSGRWVFPSVLGLFMLFQFPALFSLTEAAPWQAFAAWFAALGLT